MNHTIPDWYVQAKGSFKGGFTPEMKRKVTEEIHQKKNQAFVHKRFKLTITALVSVGAFTL